jgi:hypothetical protein
VLIHGRLNPDQGEAHAREAIFGRFEKAWARTALGREEARRGSAQTEAEAAGAPLVSGSLLTVPERREKVAYLSDFLDAYCAEIDRQSEALRGLQDLNARGLTRIACLAFEREVADAMWTDAHKASHRAIVGGQAEDGPKRHLCRECRRPNFENGRHAVRLIGWCEACRAKAQAELESEREREESPLARLIGSV